MIKSSINQCSSNRMKRITGEWKKDPESRKNILNFRKGITVTQHLQNTYSVCFTALCDENI